MSASIQDTSVVLFFMVLLLRISSGKGDNSCGNSTDCSVNVNTTQRNQFEATNYVTLPPSTTNDLHSMSMITDEELLHGHHDEQKSTREDDETNVPTIIPLTQDSKSRAINFAIDPATTNILNRHLNNLTTNFEPMIKKHTIDSTIYVTTPQNSAIAKDISDVSMDEDTEDFITLANKSKLGSSQAPILRDSDLNSNTYSKMPLKEPQCEHNNKFYKIGEKLEIGCDEVCICLPSGQMKCQPKCEHPFLRKGRQNTDNLCHIKEIPENPCCTLLVCTSETETTNSALDVCNYNNNTYQFGETFQVNCSQVCKCQETGVICKPRCEPIVNTQPDQCVMVPDPQDTCCQVLRCDVSLNEKDIPASEFSMFKILSVIPINSSSIKLEIESIMEHSPIINVVLSDDGKKTWQTVDVMPSQPGNQYYIKSLKPNTKYFVRQSADNSTVFEVKTGTDGDEIQNGSENCKYNGVIYKLNEEFHDNCTSYCICTKTGVVCEKINCPTTFGLDVLDPHCIEWETVPPNFVPKPPTCCAERVRCKNNGSCLFEGVTYPNFAEIPANITGCHRRCYCELGKIACQEACPPVTAQPPPNLPCPPHLALLTHIPEDDCCLYWLCAAPPQPPHLPNIPNGGGFPNIVPHGPFGGNNQLQDEINILELKAIDAFTVRLVMTVPPVLVGLHGRVELLYTEDNTNDNTVTWDTQVFAPPNDLIATPQLEFELPGLKPNTEYKIKINVLLRNMHNTLTSKVYKVRTAPLASTNSVSGVDYTTTPPIIPITSELKVGEINSTWITLTWRKFTDYELQYIDGIQLRYKKILGKIYSATPLIHRVITSYTIDGLKPDTEYEVQILFIPFQGQLTELKSETTLHATTLQEIDPYSFNVSVEVTQIKGRAAEITWSGVPYPQEKYVNIYRAVYETDTNKENFSTFKLAKRDAASKFLIADLKPNTNYQLVLELYLSNGKVKTSNVIDFRTKPDTIPQAGQQGQLAGVEGVYPNHNDDYYESLIIVAIVAAIAIVTTLILSSMLMKRNSQNKAAISSAPTTMRVSQASYDNPSYKVEQETMNL